MDDDLDPETGEVRLLKDVPADLHPGTIDALATALNVPGTPGRDALVAAQKALRVTYAAHGLLNNAEREVSALLPKSKRVVKGRVVETTATPEELTRAAYSMFESAAKIVDKSFAAVEHSIAVLEKQVSTALTDPEAVPGMGAEIRAHFRALDGEKRLSAGARAVDAGDVATLAALLSGPSYLSGHTREQRETLRLRAAKKLAPVAQSQLEAASIARDRVSAAGGRLVSRYADVLKAADPGTRAATAVKRLAKGVG